jgi:bifunctional non-homologous end joining protein LigD
MLPTTGRLPVGDGWAYEIKWDGVRAISTLRDGRLQIHTKGGNDVASRFPELAPILDTVGDAVVDGELVVFDGMRPDFGTTVSRLLASPAKAARLAERQPASMIVFDLLFLDGVDVRRRPYAERRALLQDLGLVGHWTVPPSFTDGAATMAASLEYGLEGVVAKKLSSHYVGRRTTSWVKVRHQNTVDAVVVGWAPSAADAGSLLLAERTQTGLVFIGRCPAPAGVLAALAPLEVADPPVTVPGPTRAVQWVRPEIEVEVDAASRRPDGRLRHPRLVRVRLDNLG